MWLPVSSNVWLEGSEYRRCRNVDVSSSNLKTMNTRDISMWLLVSSKVWLAHSGLKHEM